MAQLSLPVIQSDGLSLYLDEVKRFPVLSAEEEYMLAKRFSDSGDVNAAHQLVTSHLKLVVKIAFGFRGYGLPVMEMISEGNIGLMQAVKRFDPEKGFRLATYAMWWIKASIQEYVLRSWSLVKISSASAQKKLFFNLRKMKNQLKLLDNKALSDEHIKEIAHNLSVSEQDVKEMNLRLTYADESLNDPIYGADGEEGGEAIDYLASGEDSHEQVVAEKQDLRIKKGLLANAFGKLNEREQHVIKQRWLKENPATLEDLSQHFGISRERVRQIEARAIEKMQSSCTVTA
ncbi:MAG: RNA polymerase sigma factor RpoH [Alphaproteobacteria bacterium]|nr:RNA polymerase sigma factor RpoH [Alphaproteobacteria bacterium]